MSIVQIVLVLAIAFIAGAGGVLDQWQTHQPIVNCTLIGIVTGHPVEGVILGGTLQLIALGWMNIGAAMAPDAALAGVASAIFVCFQGSMDVSKAVAVSIPLAVAGTVLTIFVRTITIVIAHGADASAARGSGRAIEGWTALALFIQGLRVMIPAAVIMAIPPEVVTNGLNAIPDWITNGLSVAGGFIVVVGYAMVMNMMNSNRTWPFFFLGFALASLSELGLIAMGIIGVAFALIYLDLSPEFAGGGLSGSNATQKAGDEVIDDILGSEENPGEKLLSLSKPVRRAVFMRTWLLLSAFNFERMQNVGWCFALLPAMNHLYDSKEERASFMKRHLEFINTHPYLAAPIFGVVMSLEESRANGAPVDDAAIQGVKIGMMGPLAGIGDPVFWGTLRPVIGAFAASLALTGNILGPILFFVIWNVLRIAFLWYMQEFGYQAGSSITEDLGSGLLQRVTTGASVLGMFIMGVLIPRWTTIDVSAIKFSTADMGSIDKVYPTLQPAIDALNGTVNGTPATPDVIQGGLAAFQKISDAGYSIVYNPSAATGNDPSAWRIEQTTTLQSVLNQLLPGLLPLALTFLCMWLLRRKVNPISIIFGLFGIGIIGALLQLW